MLPAAGTNGLASRQWLLASFMICEGTIYRAHSILDGRKGVAYTAYLFHAGRHDDPNRVFKSTLGKSFQGCNRAWHGIYFRRQDTEMGMRQSTAEMRHYRLLENRRTKSRSVSFRTLAAKSSTTVPNSDPKSFRDQLRRQCRRKRLEAMARSSIEDSRAKVKPDQCTQTSACNRRTYMVAIRRIRQPELVLEQL